MKAVSTLFDAQCLYQVTSESLIVKDSAGNTIESQIVPVDNFTLNVRSFYMKAYLGMSSKKGPLFSLFFLVAVPPFGFNTYFISKSNGKIWYTPFPLKIIPSQNITITVKFY